MTKITEKDIAEQTWFKVKKPFNHYSCHPDHLVFMSVYNRACNRHFVSHRHYDKQLQELYRNHS